jgi:hypothetical protein
MKTIILTDRVQYQEAVKSIRDEWLSDLLIYIGIDRDIAKEMPRDAAVEYFLHNDLEVIEYIDIGALKVVHEGEVVGEWAGPDLKMREGEHGDLYYEAEIEHWSVADEEIYL